MKLSHAFTALTLVGAATGAIVACSSDGDEKEPTESASGADASLGDANGGRVDGALTGDGSITDDRDGSAVDAQADSTPGADACAVADAGVGATCASDGDCACNLVCAALKCVPRSACDDALLTWDGPTAYADGRCVDTLAGFKVYGSLDAGADAAKDASTSFAIDAGYPCVDGPMVACGDAGGMRPRPLCAYRVKSLANGLWTFSVTAYDDAGVESAPSVSASKNVSCP